MSLAGSQQKILLRLLGTLRPYWRRDAALPARIQALFAANRSFGSRDRKLYRELIYTALRYLPWIEPLLEANPGRAAAVIAWLAADAPATHAFRAAVAADFPPCPPSVAGKAAYLATQPEQLLPAWATRHCPEALEPANLDALHTRAPLWLRLQTDAPAQVLAQFDELGWAWERSAVLPTAVRLLADVDVKKTRAWQEGRIEVQDLGSQLILESIGIAPRGRWLDACAGAGGKTLQLATLLGPTGQVDAHDIRPEALRELATRASRAGLCHPMPEAGDRELGSSPARERRDRVRDETNESRSPFDELRAPSLSRGSRSGPHPNSGDRVTILTGVPAGAYDGVLVDAPCSGSGTWRRAPHLKWTTSSGAVMQVAEKQAALLSQFSQHVRPGGRLVYATCSLSRFENEDVVATFLTANADFSLAPFHQTFGIEPRNGGLTILPAKHDTDGFFVASMRRK